VSDVVTVRDLTKEGRDELAIKKKRTWTSSREAGKADKAQLLGLGAQLGLAGAMIPIMSKRVAEDLPTSTRRASGMAKKWGLPAEGTRVVRGSPAFGGTMRRVDSGRVVGPILRLPEKSVREAVLAHEIGHYKNQLRFPKGYHKVQNLSRLLYGGAGGRLATSALATMIAAGTPTPTYAPAVVGGAIAAPVLFEEAAASARAVKHMVKRHGAKGALRSLGLLPAFATYLAPALVAALVARQRKKYREEAGATKKDKMRVQDVGLLM
jgi:hypothetical protein